MAKIHKAKKIQNQMNKFRRKIALLKTGKKTKLKKLITNDRVAQIRKDPSNKKLIIKIKSLTRIMLMSQR